MRVVVQRVSKASVAVGEELVSSIGRGICALVGIAREDSDEDIEYMTRKLLNLRLFDNPETGKRWDKSVTELNLELLCVSQFTLHVSFKGNKLDFHRAMNPTQAPEFYSKFLDKLSTGYSADKIKNGRFGAMMTVTIENDGPVTFNIDSKRRE